MGVYQMRTVRMSKLLIQESPLTFQPSLAVAIGINEAIVLQQVHYWISNTRNKGYEQDGYKWVYNTYAEWKETNFPFWSENTIQRTFSNLEDAGLIVSIQPMKSKYDRTKYYRIDYTKLDMFDDPKLVRSLNESENTAENTTKPVVLTEKEIKQVNAKVDAIIANGQNKDWTEILHNFERVFGYGDLPWYSTGVWEKFAKWIIKTGGAWFADYVQWRNGDGKYKAFSNKKIRENPAAFMDTGYPEYEASKMYRKTDETKATYTTDANGVPETY